MSDQANYVKGYYSILQCVPDPERAEGVNVGIVLLCPEKGFLKAVTSKDNQRVRRLFRSQDAPDLDLKRLAMFKEAFVERVASEATSIHSLEEFQRFIDTRANQLRLTAPRFVKVDEPETELARLFELLVEEQSHPETQHTTRAATEIRRQFRALLDQRGITQKVKEKVSYDLPLLGETATYPYGYRNGQPNVIEAVSFETADERAVKDRACRLVVEGQDLGRLPEPVKLNVIGSFKPEQQERAEHIRRLLEENNVAIYTADKIESFVEEIALTAH